MTGEAPKMFHRGEDQAKKRGPWRQHALISSHPRTCTCGDRAISAATMRPRRGVLVTRPSGVLQAGSGSSEPSVIATRCRARKSRPEDEGIGASMVSPIGAIVVGPISRRPTWRDPPDEGLGRVQKTRTHPDGAPQARPRMATKRGFQRSGPQRGMEGLGRRGVRAVALDDINPNQV